MDLPEIQLIYITLIICFVVLGYYYGFKRENFGLSRTWSFIGVLPWFLLNIHQIYHITIHLMERYKGTFIFKAKWIGSCDFVLTVNPANIHYMTTSNFANYPKGEEFCKKFDFLGDSMFNADDEDWKHQRRLIHTPLRSRNYLNRSINITHSKLVQVLVPLLKHASQQCRDVDDFNLDMQDIFQRFELDVSFKSLTSHDPASLLIDSLPNVPLLGAMADSEKSIIYRFALPEYLWKLQLLTGIGPENQIRHARGIVHRYISNIIVSKRQQRDEQGINSMFDTSKSLSSSSTDDDEEGDDLLTLLMKDLTKSPHHQSGSDLKDDDAFFRDTVLHQLVAARDTTSLALTWFLWLIVTHPQIEEKIRSEINTHIISGSTNAKECHVFSSDETSKLLYLHAALNESMRLYPPAPFHCKSPREPDVLPSSSTHRVHPKTKIVIPLYAMARMKAIWGENCSDFEPGRWITERGTIKHEPASKFFVFYAGPRSCMGKEVAMIQMKMVAATLIHNFRCQLVQGQTIEPDVSMILHMKHGLKMSVYNRWT